MASSNTSGSEASGTVSAAAPATVSAPALAAENADDSSSNVEHSRSRTTSTTSTPVQRTSPLPRDAAGAGTGGDSRDSNISSSSSSNASVAATRASSSATGSSTPSGSSSTSSGNTGRRVQHIPQLQTSAQSSIPTPAFAVHRSAAGTTASPLAGSNATATFASRMSTVNSPRRTSALPLGTSSSAAATQHATPAAASAATPSAAVGAGNEGASGSQAASSSSQTLSQLSATAQTNAAALHRGVAAPAMFGSYSGGAPSLFTMATGGLPAAAGSASQPPAQQASTSTAANNAATTPARVPIAGYWRAPARPSNAHHTASASGSFAFAANNNTARNALGTATAQRPPQNGFGLAGWPTADPAGWAGNTSEVRRGDFHENSMLSFSWTVQDVGLLQEEVERSPPLTEEGRSVSAGAGRSEIWTCHPIFGDGRWKLELVRTKRSGDQEASSTSSPSSEEGSGSVNVLSAYLTSMVIDYNSGDVTIPTQLMFGIKAPASRSGAQGAGSKNWVWTYFTTYTFRREAEFFECHELPTLTTLLSNPDIAKANSFEFVVQIGTGPHMAKATSGKESAATASSTSLLSQSPFQMPDAQYVPTSMVRGLDGLIDDATTGDVALIVRERGLVPLGARQDEASEGGFEVIPWPVGSPMPNVSEDHEMSGTDVDLTPQIVVRDRVIWAHSSILAARSEYFRTMLESGFSEGQGFEEESDPNNLSTLVGRRVRVLRIADSDYTTAQALVRYLYVADIDYMESEDVRSASLDDEWMAVGGSDNGGGGARVTPLPVWEWRSLSQIEADEGGDVVDWSMHSGHPRTTSNTSSVRRSSSRELGSQQPPRSLGRSSSSRLSSGGHGRESSADEATSSSSTTCAAPRASMLRSLAQDPHPHPSPRTSRASSLGIYRLAHRYNQTCLAARSKDHLVSTLEPSNAFPILLATHLYPDLYYSVQKFVLENWESVSATREFERCCDEVSEGEWGIDAGRALRSFMRSLTSPTAIGVRSATSNGPTPPPLSHAGQQHPYYMSRGSQGHGQTQPPDRAWRYSAALYH